MKNTVVKNIRSLFIYQICIDAQKIYPETEIPYPKMNSKVETNAKMTVSAGYTDDDKCVRDEMLVTMTVKGEMTEEQKNQMAHDNVHGDCVKDMANPMFVEKENHIPKTMNCIRETVQYTTMRKYTINAFYKKVNSKKMMDNEPCIPTALN